MLMLCVQKLHQGLHFLKLLKRSELSTNDSLFLQISYAFCLSVLEYGSVVWHHHLTHVQTRRLKMRWSKMRYGQKCNGRKSRSRQAVWKAESILYIET